MIRLKKVVGRAMALPLAGGMVAAALGPALLGAPPTASGAAVSTVEPAAAAVAVEPARREWFRDQAYGLFLHWGPMVVNTQQYGKAEISYSRAGVKPDGWGTSGFIPPAQYDASYQTFNPTAFDPTAWVEFAKAAGMKYVTITARHHDGFSMFDSAHSPDSLKITATDGAHRAWVAQQNPSFTEAQVRQETDIVRQLGDAVHAAGLGFGIYYSEPDWVREDYTIAITGKNFAGQTVSPAVQAASAAQYRQFMHDQLEELTTNYGRVDILWFDAIKPDQQPASLPRFWVRPDTIEMIRANQPGIVINDRQGETPDYITPEGVDASYQPGIYQESSKTIGRTWAWDPQPSNPTPGWVIERLAVNNSRNSNFHLNMGPSPQGTLHASEMNLLRQAGTFITDHAAAFYGTRAGTVHNRTDYVTTRNGDTTYLHVLSPALAGQQVQIPSVSAVSAVRWDNGDPVNFHVTGGSTYVTLPSSIHPLDEIITLTTPPGPPLVDGKAYTLTASHSSKLATVSGGSAVDGAAVVQQPATGAPSQKWVAQAAGSGFNLRNLGTGKCLTVPGGSLANNTGLDQWTCTSGANNQVWSATSVGNGGFQLVNARSGKCLDVPGASQTSGQRLTQYTCTPGAANQVWRLAEDTGFFDGLTYALTASHSSQLATVSGGSSVDGAPVVQQPANGSASQRWVAVPTAGTGYFKLRNVGSDKCLTVPGGSLNDGAALDQWTCLPGASNQIWTATYAGNGTYQVVGARSGKCLEVPGATQTVGQRLAQRTCVPGAAHQRWTLTIQ